MTQQAWEQLTQNLGKRLLALDDGDTIILHCGDYYVQCQSGVDDLHLEAVSNHNLPPERRLSGEQEERMVALGSQPPRPPGYFNYHVNVDLPLSTQDAVRVASLLVGALRDVYGVDSPEQIEEKAINAFQGAHGPTSTGRRWRHGTSTRCSGDRCGPAGRCPRS